MEKQSESADVCAPGVDFLGGSCISIDILEDMIVMYNKSHKDKIDISHLNHLRQFNPVTYKKRVVTILKEKMKQYKCDTQTCWLSLPFFGKLSTIQNTQKLHKQTFKPKGPRNTNEWLNTFDINDIFVQYEKIYPDFKFMGAHPIDFDNIKLCGIRDMSFIDLIKKGKFRLGFIFNLDRHDQSGSHWVSLYAHLLKGQIYFVDSVGDEPKSEINALMNRIKKFCETNTRHYFCEHNEQLEACKNILNKVDMRCNKTQHQHGGSECGVYSTSFILRFLDGETFEDITGNKVSDEEIELCRASYFRSK